MLVVTTYLSSTTPPPYPLPQLPPVPTRMLARPANSDIKAFVHIQWTRRQVSCTSDLLKEKVHAVISMCSRKFSRIVVPHVWLGAVVVVINLLANRVEAVKGVHIGGSAMLLAADSVVFARSRRAYREPSMRKSRGSQWMSMGRTKLTPYASFPSLVSTHHLTALLPLPSSPYTHLS